MKVFLFISHIICGSLLISTFTCNLSAQDKTNIISDSGSHLSYDPQMWNSIENELWRLEESYMLNYMRKDIEAISKFWHEKFVGWPTWAEKPLDKEHAISILQQSENSRTRSFKIRPQKIVLIDSLAVIHYLIDIEQENRETERIESTFRIIHTWLKQNGKWKILSGMSAL